MTKYIAIIGHGRSPEGKGWGKRIDACEVVIRMWDWHWQAVEDYGSKYDYGLFEVCPKYTKVFLQHYKKVPAEGWIASYLRDSRCQLPPRTEVFSQVDWSLKGRSMGGIGETGRLEFTRGTLAALWAIDRICDRSDEIYLVGFDNVKLGRSLPMQEAFSKVYQQNPGTYPFDKYVSGVSKYGNHDYAIEYPLMEKMAAPKKIKVKFAQDVW